MYGSRTPFLPNEPIRRLPHGHQRRPRLGRWAAGRHPGCGGRLEDAEAGVGVAKGKLQKGGEEETAYTIDYGSKKKK